MSEEYKPAIPACSAATPTGYCKNPGTHICERCGHALCHHHHEKHECEPICPTCVSWEEFNKRYPRYAGNNSWKWYCPDCGRDLMQLCPKCGHEHTIFYNHDLQFPEP
jgi:hypothetical protein